VSPRPYSCLYRHDQGQVIIWATITSTTPGIIQALINDPPHRHQHHRHTPPDLFADLMTAAITTRDCKQSRVSAF